MIRSEVLQIKIQIELRQESADSFVATCPQLGCIFVHEESEEAAIRHVHEAVDSYVITALEHNDPLPDEVVVSRTVDTHEVRSKNPKVTRRPTTALDLISKYDVPVPVAAGNV